MLAAARPGRAPVAALVALAMVWSTAPLLADLVARLPTRSRRHRFVDTGADGSFTTLVRPGDEPDEVVRAAVLMAAAAGPVAVVAGDREVPDGLDALAPVHRAATTEAAVAQAARAAGTDAVLIVSARSVPHAANCRSAAARLHDSVGWVTGRVQPFTPEGFAPDHRDALSARLRARARRAGLASWEPDATLVRTDLLVAYPVPHGRPWGSWLRALTAHGLRGAETSDVLALRSTPLDAAAYWPDAIARQRGAAADLAAATRTGGPRRRLLAALLLCSELYGVGLLCWSSLPLLMGASGELPVDLPRTAVAVAAALLVARWWSLRAALGLRPNPTGDVLSALHHLPGSLAAVWGATTARIRPLRAAIPTRPLVWVSLALTLLAAAPLVDHEPGAPVSRTAVGTSLATLCLLWAFTIRSLVQRSWQRRAHRVPLDLAVSLDGRPGRTVDGSPSGLALRGGRGLVDDLAPGAAVDVAVVLPDGEPVRSLARVVGLRPSGDDVVVGLELELDEATRARWLALLLHEGTNAPVPGGARRPLRGRSPGAVSPARRVRSLLDGLALALVGAASIAVLGAVGLVMFGVHPLVVRSPSMTPTLQVGDVVLSEQVPAEEIRPGDVVTQPERPGGAEAVTHRVVSVEDLGDVLRVETRGDANRSSEVWAVHGDTLVGRQRGTVPWVGRVATGVRHSGAQLAVASLCLAIAVGALLRGWGDVGPRARRARHGEPDAHEVPEPQRLPAAVGRRGRPGRPG